MHPSTIGKQMISSQSRFLFCIGCSLLIAFTAHGGATAQVAVSDNVPIVLDPDWELRLVATDPQLVTPVSCRFNSAGRLFVVESHTHFPGQDYPGPKFDRIHWFDSFVVDSNSSRVRADQGVWFSGGQKTMGMTILPDDSLVIVTRNQVLRLSDTDHDGAADEPLVLLELETSADYPHNGLSGIALGPDGRLTIGMGENFGAKYQLKGRDGSVQSGAGEGGNLFRCTIEGNELERLATGFWNPFGIAYDPAGRLWAVENDPDSRPPCRLLHIQPGGDYGFQFQFGWFVVGNELGQQPYRTLRYCSQWTDLLG
jgi:putative membrane-bound dehydrogenase-like protein